MIIKRYLEIILMSKYYREMLYKEYDLFLNEDVIIIAST